jgi:hypothetical protein
MLGITHENRNPAHILLASLALAATIPRKDTTKDVLQVVGIAEDKGSPPWALSRPQTAYAPLQLCHQPTGSAVDWCIICVAFTTVISHQPLCPFLPGLRSTA